MNSQYHIVTRWCEQQLSSPKVTTADSLDVVGLEPEPAEAEAEAEVAPLPEAHTPPSQRSHQACVIGDSQCGIKSSIWRRQTVSPVCDAPGSPMHKGAPQHTRALCCVGGGADYALGAKALVRLQLRPLVPCGKRQVCQCRLVTKLYWSMHCLFKQPITSNDTDSPWPASESLSELP